MVAVISGIITSHGVVAGKATNLRDTGIALLTFGREVSRDNRDARYGLCAHIGIINGAVLTTWQDIVAWSDGGSARTSPESSGATPFLGVASRLDKSVVLATSRFANLDISTAAFARLSTFAVSGGGAATVSVRVGGHAEYAPTLPGLPDAALPAGSLVDAGTILRGSAYDRPTHALDRYPAKMTAVTGGSIGIRWVRVGLEYQRDRTPDVYHDWGGLPVSRKTMTVSVTFCRGDGRTDCGTRSVSPRLTSSQSPQRTRRRQYARRSGSRPAAAARHATSAHG